MDKRSYATVEKYAAPFVQIVLEKNQQRDVFRELSQIKGIFEETRLADFLSHIGVSQAEKSKILRLFQTCDSVLVNNLIEVLITNGREDFFYPILLDSLKKIEKETNEFEVTVHSVEGLSEEQKARLIPVIEKKMNLKVRSIKENLDRSLIGGFAITANHKIIDTSIKRQLKAVKEKLK
ncbi:F0F1 ATP synthase subunit delta [Streptococcus gordonii]|uniref:F0F1 ATP synthase subunit delta n=1 Tax=Streptococcus gordonii TaxID=1302 RepID=UPI0010E12459|nr:F0F1 ATP synthase subunit delta [Streptococcus gordonii]MBX9098124.1 F0F1 ATP synthase subunit delta [Streptococcus gordonii]MCG4823260.1 F0F1 ATP synthase subunit delta [Streptococcus gordonii]MCG4848608.1 F0F1 ATP synthase subunit delta [Streptococcus gordonii]MDE8685896.1 F0F1 ATP synthase subunit delta [Streptococcus gordonii]VTS38757.1 F0F1 ATP synthase subunit delta [Streptococcus gordonii]